MRDIKVQIYHTPAPNVDKYFFTCILNLDLSKNVPYGSTFEKHVQTSAWINFLIIGHIFHGLKKLS